MNLGTEKQILKAIEATSVDLVGDVLIKKNGNHVIVFSLEEKQICRFTLRQIIGKRYARRKKKV